FGLINRGKGIEVAIQALAKIVEKHPEIIYLIVGATHPTVLKNEGESYRNSLIDLVKKYALQKNVRFINRFMDYDELIDYLQASDIYLAPQLDFNQAFSGTLSYAIGCGCAVISSPTHYAREILASGRGTVVEPDPDRLAQEIAKLAASPDQLKKIQLMAYQYSRKMVFASAGLEYLKVIESNLFTDRKKWVGRIPDFSRAPSLKYLQKMTDDFGIIQHSVGDRPDLTHGYSIDDQARGLIVCKMLQDQFPELYFEVTKLIEIYLNYLEYAVDSKGTIHNFIDKNRKPTDREASEDSIARSFWALATLAKSNIVDLSIKKKANKLLAIYRGKIKNEHVKPTAYNLLGHCVLKDAQGLRESADLLIRYYRETVKIKKDGWHWFEGKLSWGNPIVPYSLLRAYEVVNKNVYLRVAYRAISFLEKAYLEDDVPSPVGQQGWYFRGKKKAVFDQQPIEAADMVIMYNELFRFTADKKYKNLALKWIGWYFGNNIKNVIVYDNASRGVFDGLTKNGVNTNRGAESILTYLMAYLSFNAAIYERAL
ncbi:MAG: glycosyltransferase, partial [Magnetococcus sp. WYHC-3]